ncbi:MAG: NAD-dependent epimerase/dehydratase family protein [Deltaproteobacteria bacterium]|nr:NAD-dependent epimerase/dehydratase family protein [Deltaproteobacteria bacterium]
MKALVTGAGGFLGHALCRRLCEAGHGVRALVREGSDRSLLSGLPVSFVQGDVTHPDSLRPAVEGVEVVFHLAGLRRAPVRGLFQEVNVEGTRHVCEAMVTAGTPRRLVFAGSLSALGPSRPGHPHGESAPFAPAEWYGESKRDAEVLTHGYGDRLEVSTIRPVRILGPGDRENLAFFRLVSRGLRLELGGGPRPLCMVDVEDVVTQMMLQATHPAAVGEAFFCASPEEVSLEWLQEEVASELGVHPRTLHLPPAVLTALAAVADGASQLTGRHLPLNRKLARQLLAPAWTCRADKAERLLGHRSARPLSASVRASARWYREQGWL